MQQEGNARELIRSIQQLRKEAGLKPADEVSVSAPKNIESEIVGFVEEVKKSVRAKEIIFTDDEEIKVQKV